MVPVFYLTIFAASLLCSTIYVFRWYKHSDVNFTLVFVLVPVACLGYAMLGLSENLRECIAAIKITYIGGCFLQLFFLLCILNLCQIEVSSRLRTLLFVFFSLIFGTVLSIGYSDIFYKDITFSLVDGAPVLVKTYGWMHSVFYVVILSFLASGFIAIFYSWANKRQVPKTILTLLVFPDFFCVLTFFLGRRITNRVDLVPLGYLLAQIMYMIIANRVTLYDVADTAIDSMMQEKTMGYLCFDFRYRYLGSDEIAKALIPGLSALAVDDVLGDTPSEKKIRHYLDTFQADPNNQLFVYTLHDPDGDPDKDRIYNVKVSHLYAGRRRHGFFLTFTDDTANRKYIRLLDTYNEQLHQQVEEKTKSIVEMHDNLIVSMAMMVESRDNSTGGHIKRTSEGVRILVDAIRKAGSYTLSEEFCADVIKAAPMHDLGKIAVDDAVLRKPGRFTPEEYEKMKKHAEEGARVIHEILLHTNDHSFKIVAENVAHYHHERWDGSGYPEGLAGKQIPFEARIMAIADVYDALVSRRVYKEAFDFARADAIILDGMGTQFDPGLKAAYQLARPRLEEYYKSEQAS